MKEENKYLNDIEFIKDWCSTVIAYMSSLTPEKEHLAIFQTMKENLQMEFSAKDKKILAGFKEFFSIVSEWAYQLPNKNYLELDKILTKKFGKGLSNVHEKNIEAVQSIYKRSKILTEEEYRLLLARADEVYSDESKKEELDLINKLLTDYHQKK